MCVWIRDRQGWKNDLDTAAKLFANSAGQFYNREDTNKAPSNQDIVKLELKKLGDVPFYVKLTSHTVQDISDI